MAACGAPTGARGRGDRSAVGAPACQPERETNHASDREPASGDGSGDRIHRITSGYDAATVLGNRLSMVLLPVSVDSRSLIARRNVAVRPTAPVTWKVIVRSCTLPENPVELA